MYIKNKFRAVIRSSVATAVAVVILLGTQAPIQADDLSNLRSKYADLQQQQQQLQQQLNDQKSQYNKQSQQKAILDSQISVTRQQITVLNAQISSLDAKLDQKNQDIVSTEQRIKENYNLFKQRLCAMYKSGSDSYIDVLLSSDSLTGFFLRVDTLKFISQHDRELIESLQQDEIKLKNDKAALESDKKNLESSQGTLAAKRDTLNAQLEQQNKIVNDIKNDMDSTQQQVNSVKQQAKMTDAQINAIIAAQAAARRKQLQAQGGGSGSVSGQNLVGYAESFIGTPYVYGSADPSGFDCSGFTSYVYANSAGIYLPHSAAGQSGYGTPIGRDDLQPGDLVFFCTGGGGINHVGIYVGGGNFIAANTGSNRGVNIQSINSAYWSGRYECARRLV